MFRVVITVPLAFFAASIGVAQSAVLFDDISRTTEDELSARLANLLVTLDTGRAHGLIVIGGTAEQRYLMERRILSLLSCRRSNGSRVDIRFVSSDGDLRTRMWVVPDGAIPTPIEFVPKDFSLPGLKESFLLNPPSVFGCRDPDGRDDFASFLAANPNLRGRIAIAAKSSRKFRRKVSAYWTYLTKAKRIDRRRLKFVRKRGEESDGDDLILDPVVPITTSLRGCLEIDSHARRQSR